MVTIKIPLEALEVHDTRPEKGDEVDANITGKVLSISENDADVQVTMVNGVAYEEPAEDTQEEGPEAEIARMRKAAKKSDKQPIMRN